MHRALPLVWFILLLSCSETQSAAAVAEVPAESDARDASTRAPDEPTVRDLTVSLEPPGNGYQIITPPYVVPPGTEVDICTVVRVDPKAGERFTWAHRLESLVSEGTHHMNVFIGQFSFLDGYLGDGASEGALDKSLGQYPCDEIDVMESAFPVFPSQQQNQHIVMPEGVAIPMPLPLVLIAGHHYINPTTEPVRINAALNMENIASSEVKEVAGLVFDVAPTNIPSGTRKVEQATCIFEQDTEMVLVSTHNHAWTECATLNHFDGETQTVAVDPFYVNRNWDQPPILNFDVGEFTMKAGDGVHFACHYNNYTDRTLINDGTADGEMCVFAAVSYPLPFTVSEVESVLSGDELAELLNFMDVALGPCDRLELDTPSPWPTGTRATSDSSTCIGLSQTVGN
ncbi:MAG: hypothetical protein VX223_04515 [Myxococcota bacterium]|nr:hypothetical protein [Myxococcota bacterium]